MQTHIGTHETLSTTEFSTSTTPLNWCCVNFGCPKPEKRGPTLKRQHLFVGGGGFRAIPFPKDLSGPPPTAGRQGRLGSLIFIRRSHLPKLDEFVTARIGDQTYWFVSLHMGIFDQEKPRKGNPDSRSRKPSPTNGGVSGTPPNGGL